MTSGSNHSHPHRPFLGRRGIGAGLLAAFLFGASTPLAKLLLAGVGPWMLAGLLYLGSGLGLGLICLVRPSVEPMARRELPWLAGAILSGGVVAPVLLMVGLAATSGSTASLLLTTEGVFTALLAWAVFGEMVNRRIAVGMACITLGAMALAWDGTPTLDRLGPPLAVLAACLCWGIDNNLTRKISLSDPLRITALKGLVAGLTNLGLALALGAVWPEPTLMAKAALVGLVGYGVSLVLYVLALRDLGAARAGAYFSAAPLMGALLALPLLGEAPSGRLALAGGLMALGLWLHLTERHDHPHDHPLADHDHLHDHDDPHHAHSHPVVPAGPHSHPHHHGGLRHSHSHFPDAHHRHDHEASQELPPEG